MKKFTVTKKVTATSRLDKGAGRFGRGLLAIVATG
jgi:hypothetical protein